MTSPFLSRPWGRNAILMVAVLLSGTWPCSLAEESGAGANEGFPNGVRFESARSRGGLSDSARARRVRKALSPAARKAAHAPYQAGGHFAEIDVVLDASLTLDDLATMPHAPGSDVEVLEGGRRARVQLPATRVGDLIERGQEVTVLRDFMLSEVSRERDPANRNAFAVVAAECSGDFAEVANETDYAIPEYDWAYSEIRVESAPANAVVTCVDVHFEIVHPLIGDLWVDLSDEGLTHEYNLWFMEGGFDENISETVTGITEFAGERVNQVWGLWATDVVPGYDGYIDSWWIKVYYEERDIVLAHDEPNAPAVLEEGVPFRNTTLGATGQYETRCGFQDVLDVWHVYTPAQGGVATVRVESAEFDTTLAVFDPCGVEQACNDDDCESTDSMITMPVTAETPYLIRVAGYDYETGDYALVVDQPFSALPVEPNQPWPADGAGIDVLPVTLSWNGAASGATTPDVDLSVTRPGPGSVAGPRTIYGNDGRTEEYEVTDPRALAVGGATAMLMYRHDLLDNGDGTYELQIKSLAWWYAWLDPIETGNPLCDDEPFRDQPAVGTCTGVLVGPDLIATAGHCVACLEPSLLAVVFGFVMQDAETAVVTLRQDQVYGVTEVVASQAGFPDWGLVRLDREVIGRTSLRLRRMGRVADGQPVLVVGHPWGIPRKYDAGAIVRENAESTFFQANLDTYRGNSGSPVVNLDTMVVEGLLVRGMPEFAEDVVLGCDRSLTCPDTGCIEDGVPQWEDVTRASTFAAAVPAFDVYLGTDPNQLALVGGDLVVPRYEPAPLQKDAVYYWRVVARNGYGRTAGPLWSFVTTLAPSSP